MGQTPNAIPARLARQEPIDVVIMVGDALDKLMASGALVPGSKVALWRVRAVFIEPVIVHVPPWYNSALACTPGPGPSAV